MKEVPARFVGQNVVRNASGSYQTSDRSKTGLGHGPGPVIATKLPRLDDAVPSFVELTDRWFGLEANPDLKRLGFGADVIKAFSDLEDCYRELDPYLPAINMQRAGSPGFVYQTNRQCSSQTIDGLLVNRFTKWSIIQFQSGDARPAMPLGRGRPDGTRHTTNIPACGGSTARCYARQHREN